MAKTITFGARSSLPRELDDLAKDWGYKHYGNGGYTCLVGDILEAIVDKAKDPKSNFDLSTLIDKKKASK